MAKKQATKEETKLNIEATGNVGLNITPTEKLDIVEDLVVEEEKPLSTAIFDEIDDIQTIELGKLLQVKELIYDLKIQEAIELLQSVQTIDKYKVDSIISQIS